jgi:triphosphoribosyl-dephospho-CoA synthase
MTSHLLTTTPQSASSYASTRPARMARLARQALIAEAELTPKPGLVDRRGGGCHSDLSLAIMRRSSFAIEPYFCDMALVSMHACPSQQVRERLAAIGREAESDMLKATGRSNSHRGSIWTLGLLVSAAVMHTGQIALASEIASTAMNIAHFQDRAAPRVISHGHLVAKRCGVAGARGEARRGFPHVVDTGLPTLRARRAAGAIEQVARMDALLSIMSTLDDTCVLYRGGDTALRAAQEGAAAVGRAGGSGTATGRQGLECLECRLLELGVSPGGSADLFAATLLLDALERKQEEIEPDESYSGGRQWSK